MTPARVVKNHRNEIFIAFQAGRKYVHCVRQAQPVRLDKLTHDQDAALTPALLKGEPYPVDRACRRFLAFGKSVGITKGARAAVKQILSECKT